MSRRASLTKAFRLVLAVAVGSSVLPAAAQNTAELDGSAKRALAKLIDRVPAAKALSNNAVAILIFPRITKVGLVFGGQYGEGVLLRDGKPVAYYSNAGASWGLEAGAQQYGYAMFFMNEGALRALTDTSGFEIGVGPSVVVVDQGMAMSLTTMNASSDIYAFVFSQRGLMPGAGLRGNRIAGISG